MVENKRQDLLNENGIEKLEKNIEDSDWVQISKCKLSREFVREFQEKLYWKTYCDYHRMSEDFIREFENKVNWIHISKTHNLSEDFIIEFKEKINWKLYLQKHSVNYNIIRKFIFSTDIKNTDDFITSHLYETQISEIARLLKLKKIFKV
jgi:hypothetical protein